MPKVWTPVSVGHNMASPSPSSNLVPQPRRLPLPRLAACLPVILRARHRRRLRQLRPPFPCAPSLPPSLPPRRSVVRPSASVSCSSSHALSLIILPQSRGRRRRRLRRLRPLRFLDQDETFNLRFPRDFAANYCDCFCETSFPRLAWFLVLAWRSIGLGCFGDGRIWAVGRRE